MENRTQTCPSFRLPALPRRKAGDGRGEDNKEKIQEETVSRIKVSTQQVLGRMCLQGTAEMLVKRKAEESPKDPALGVGTGVAHTLDRDKQWAFLEQQLIKKMSFCISTANQTSK